MEIPIGQILFGRYKVTKKLGEGYFGRVYLAQDPKLPRLVAIKELKSRFLEEPRIVQRFANDARAAAALQHPNIVTVFDLRPEDQPRFILLEYLAKGSLRELLQKESPLKVERAVKIAAEICSALVLAHQRGIIHRDIKPENTLFADGGTTKLCDFGIAHLPQDLGRLNVTYADGQPGTPIYMSPEQVRGGVRLDGGSDLYTVGVVLYEMLAGRHYFDYSSCTRDDCRALILNHQPIPPSRFNPKIPQSLDQVVLKLLNKRREDRFQSAMEAVSALEDFTVALVGRRDLHPRPTITAINTSSHREGSRYRHHLTIEAVNDGSAEALWGGVTAQFPTLTSEDQVVAQEIRAWGGGGANPMQYLPSELLWGFLGDHSWGQKPAKHLMIESVMNNWPPGQRISLEVVLTVQFPRLDAAIRAWATWKKTDGSEASDGDPPWSATAGLDQQGFPTYPLTIGFKA